MSTNSTPNNNFRTSKLIQSVLVGLRDDKTESVVDLSNGLLNDDDVACGFCGAMPGDECKEEDVAAEA